MAEPVPTVGAPAGARPAAPRRLAVVLTGLGVTSAFGRGTDALLAHAFPGAPAFGPVTRFATGHCRSHTAAELPAEPVLASELAAVIGQACDGARLSGRQRAQSLLLLALHTDPGAARDPAAAQATGTVAAGTAALAGIGAVPTIYTTACVAASTAVADAAAMISAGQLDRVIVAAGYLVEADSFGLFDAGRALATDGACRPFSAGRRGMQLGDGVAAVVLESAASAASRGAEPLATLAGWGRAGDAYHVCQPRPDGSGLARAIGGALRRARIGAQDVGYLNASGSATPASDQAEATALRQVFGPAGVPVSSTKSSHGHALEASALLELVVTVLAVRACLLPVNAGYLAADERCALDLVLGAPRHQPVRYALSVNSAFGGANTALLVGAG